MSSYGRNPRPATRVAAPIPDRPDAAALRQKAIDDAVRDHKLRGLVSFGEQETENGSRYELFYEVGRAGMGMTNRSLRRYPHDPTVLVPLFDTTPPPQRGEQFTLPTAREWVNANSQRRPDPPPEPMGGPGLTAGDTPRW